MFAIRDSKGEMFFTPFFMNTHGEAERDFRSLANNKENPIGQYPEDYDLYYLGEYDNSTGKTNACDTPQHVQKAALLLNGVTTM